MGSQAQPASQQALKLKAVTMLKTSLICLSLAALACGQNREPPAEQRCSGRNYNGRRCCTPEQPCGLGEGDCDGPPDGGVNETLSVAAITARSLEHTSTRKMTVVTSPQLLLRRDLPRSFCQACLWTLLQDSAAGDATMMGEDAALLRILVEKERVIVMEQVMEV